MGPNKLFNFHEKYIIFLKSPAKFEIFCPTLGIVGILEERNQTNVTLPLFMITTKRTSGCDLDGH